MATQTFQHSSFGGVLIEFDVNDVNWRMSRVRCINDSTHPAYARILNNGVQVFEATAPAGQTTSFNTTGIQLGWDSVDGGLMMGNYMMQTRWPSEV